MYMRPCTCDHVSIHTVHTVHTVHTRTCEVHDHSGAHDALGVPRHMRQGAVHDDVPEDDEGYEAAKADALWGHGGTDMWEGRLLWSVGQVGQLVRLIG